MGNHPFSSAGRRAAAALAASVLAAAGGVAAVATPAAAVHGGRSASVTDHPYAMLIETPDGTQFCGGTLVAPTKVLTAAHCVADAENPRELVVIGGRTTLSSGKGTVRHISSIKVHPKFEQATLTHDAAVLTLDRAMPYKPLPVAGPKDTALYASGTKATITGWGRTGTDSLATRLKSAELRLAPLKKCDPFTFPTDTTALRVCGVPAPGAHDSVCKGDSGGPLTAGGKLIGIVSTGNKYCDDTFPVSVFTRASAVAKDLGLPVG
ncbi:S1 family peptidase [Streptomyces sp. NPDC001744]|uniref:S1 family peptidase n=1 Tax=Streptomyces sp. NPDC001744 TaxID=3364606 RepID=UPI00367E1AA4